MKLKFLLFFLFSTYFLSSQTIKFVDTDNNAIKDVYLEFSYKNQKIKKISDENGIIKLNQFYNKELFYSISHVSFITISSKSVLNDTTFYLEKNNFIVDEVFVTGQIKPTKISDVIQKSIIISKKDIEMQAANNLKDLLEKQLNMSVTVDNILGSSVSIQGISGQNVKILIDGIPVIGRLNGNIDLTQINLNNIERVEIIEGPLSVDYGTDALAGTINLITDKQLNDGFSSTYNLYYETVGQYNFDFILNFKRKGHAINFDFGRKYFDGWSKNDDFNLFPVSQLADTNRVKSWNPKEQYFGKVQYSYKTDNSLLRVFYDSFDEKISNFGFPRLPYYENAFDDYYFTKRNNVAIDYKYIFNDNKNLHLISSYSNFNRRKNTYFKDLTTLEEVLTNNNSDQDTSLFNLIMNKLVFSSFKSNNFNYQIGIDSKFENGEGIRITNNKQLSDQAIYFSSKWKPRNNLSLKPALRFSYNSMFNVPIIPSLNSMLLFNNFNIRLAYAKGFRSPSIKELYFEFVDVNHNILGNENLVPEDSDNLQFTLDYSKRFSNYKIETGIKLFHNDIRNLITLAQSPNSSEYSYFNLGRYKTRGFSSNLSLFTQALVLNFSYGVTGRYNDLSEEFNIVDFSFSNSVKSNINYKLKKYYTTVSLYYNFTGKLPIFYKDEDQIIEAEKESYQLIDLVLNKAFNNYNMNFSFGIKNLLDVQDITNYATNEVHSSSNSYQSVAYGRTFFTSISFKL